MRAYEMQFLEMVFLLRLGFYVDYFLQIKTFFIFKVAPVKKGTVHVYLLPLLAKDRCQTQPIFMGILMRPELGV